MEQEKKRYRKKSTAQERMQPCELCKYPLSQRHHLLDFAFHGETDSVYRLCANCHELYHLVYDAYVNKFKKSVEILGTLYLYKSELKEKITKLHGIVMEVERIKRKMELDAIEQVLKESEEQQKEQAS